MFQWRIKIYWLVSSYQKWWLKLRFQNILHLFNKTLDKHAPIKQEMRKDKKLELTPWVTKGIKTSTKRQIIQRSYQRKGWAKKNQEIWNLQELSKQICIVLKVSKWTHYKKHFEENKKKTIKLFGMVFMKLNI